MSLKWHNRLVRTFILALAALPLSTAMFAASHTALDRYVAAPDPNYKYELARTAAGRGYTQYVYDLTSQKWRTEKDVDHPLWHHWLTIIVPDKVEKTTGFLYLTGGSVDAAPPEQPDALVISAATSTNTITAELRGIPNEPLLFTGETKPRTEDGAIVYTWDKFMRGGDETWPLRLPPILPHSCVDGRRPPGEKAPAATAFSMNKSGSSTKTSIRTVVWPMTRGLENPLSFDSWRKNGAPPMSNPRTEPRLHNSLAPSAEMYHSAAAGASSTASMSEIDSVMHHIVNAGRKPRHRSATLNRNIDSPPPITSRFLQVASARWHSRGVGPRSRNHAVYFRTPVRGGISVKPVL